MSLMRLDPPLQAAHHGAGGQADASFDHRAADRGASGQLADHRAADHGAPANPFATAHTRRGDRLFKAVSVSAALAILALLSGVALFLVLLSQPALTASPADLKGLPSFGAFVLPLVFGTLQSSAIAVAIATPLAIGIALFITHYAPAKLAATLGYVVDLLAAVPSIIYGLWGASVVAVGAVPAQQWLSANLGWLPFFGANPSPSGRTMLVTGIVLAIMIVPIMTAINREVFAQTPILHQEAAIGLGATKLETIRLAVLPHGTSGVIAGIMLGLGRALGETMAVAIILSSANIITWDIIGTTNANTIAANIARDFPESSGVGTNVLIASGLVLFVITLVVNMLARAIVARTRP